MRSRKPIGSSASTAGAGRPLKPAACSPARAAAHSSPSMLPECALPCTCRPHDRPFAKVTAPVKAEDTSPGEVHDIALKAAETDATKRALSTFGKPFGLALYGKGKTPSAAKAPAPEAQPVDPNGHIALPATIPRQFLGRLATTVGVKISGSRDLASRTRIQADQHDAASDSRRLRSIVPTPPDLSPWPDRQERSHDRRAQTAS